ncbi:MAG: hypothetical protein CVT62_10460 [Actinobacteria bacterium HGW-Actinobacteria-2]|nr:MAG: hypothetical protein CVT62_10460 [Actinobacteria bacterium HGW-Actinobacteria-2]
MKRIQNTWPYLVGVAVLAIGWLLIAKFTLGSADLDGLTGLYIGTVVPLAVAGGGAVLTVRNGYDWITIIACLVVWVIFALIGVAIGVPMVPAAATAATAAYLVIAHVGVVAVLAFRRMDRNGPSAGV